MGTMLGSWKRRKFGDKIFYHYGNSDSMGEAKLVVNYWREHQPLCFRITNDGYGGADIWISKKRGIMRSFKLMLGFELSSKLKHLKKIRRGSKKRRMFGGSIWKAGVKGKVVTKKVKVGYWCKFCNTYHPSRKMSHRIANCCVRCENTVMSPYGKRGNSREERKCH
jgi:hypothetical protein